MNLIISGVSHKTAAIEVRERLAISEANLGPALAVLRRRSEIREAVLLSTCNRLELIADCAESDCDLLPAIAECCGAAKELFALQAYRHQGEQAIQHLFAVASSLDSMVVGEPQILGQVKKAYALARRAGLVGASLDFLFMRAFAVAKRVRSETAIGGSPVSIASAAVELARQIFGTLAGKKVLLVGAGKMSELAARHLGAQGASEVLIANRTEQRAREAAERAGGTVVPFAQLYEAAAAADIVITATGAAQPVFQRRHGEHFLSQRKRRPMFFIDIALPRDVDPAMSELEGIFVYDLDDLRAVVERNSAARGREAQRARAIIVQEVARFQERLENPDLSPTIISLHEHLEQIRRAEVERARARLGNLSPQQEQALEALTRGIVNKILHSPVTALKGAARDGASEAFIEAVQALFNLSPADNLQAEKQTAALEAAAGVLPPK